MSASQLFAAFGEFEIRCDIGDQICGWIPPKRLVRFKTDPLLGNVAMLKNDAKTLVICSMDVVGILNEDADHYRTMVAEALGISCADVTVAATHSHSGPATYTSMDCDKDEALMQEIGRDLVAACLKLRENLQPAVMGCGIGFENEISWNRRYIMRDGSAFAMPTLDRMDNLLCAEGPIDPQVGVVCVRNRKGLAMGYLVNFACHPLFYGGQRIASPNFPGELRKELKRMENADCVTVFLNGAEGDIAHTNPYDRTSMTCEKFGKQLAKRSYEVALKLPYDAKVTLDSAVDKVGLPKRRITDEHIARAERILAGETSLKIDPRWFPASTMTPQEYARQIICLRERADAEPNRTHTVQALRIGNSVWALCPVELFCRYGIEIKIGSSEKNTFVVSLANGKDGYVSTPEAQLRGGMETTPMNGSDLDCSAGEIIVTKLCEMITRLEK